MSQKKSKLINKYIKSMGLDEMGRSFKDIRKKLHVILASKELKKAYNEANHVQKYALTVGIVRSLNNNAKN